MDFFAAQDNARKQTRFLVLAFIGVLIALSLCVYLVLHYGNHGTLPQVEPDGGLQVDWELLSLVSIGLFAVIGGLSLFHIGRLARGGGAYVAETMGGALLSSATAKGSEQQLLNVVQEMAIASGTPVPPVYVIDDPSINAFAAGSTINNAVIGVTRGAMDSFTRDEMQGVIAHEFSHIVNGDMRLNIKLTGVIFGLTALATLGRVMIYSRSRRDNNIAVALVLIVAGYVGVLIGSLLRAAISRQREYLADAASVQYTRNPDGIAGALDRIGRSSTALEHPKAEEASHMFIASLSQSFTNPFATHPPIADRIRAVKPDWDGKSRIAKPKKARAGRGKTSSESAPPSASPRQQAAAAAIVTGAAAIGAIGQVDDAALERSRTALEHVRKPVQKALATDALAVPYAMLLSVEDTRQREHQLQLIEDRQIRTLVEELFAQSTDWMPADRFAAVQLALPGLRQLGDEQCISVINTMAAIVQADGKVTMLEWGLWGFVVHALEDNLASTGRRKRAEKQHLDYVISVLARLVSGKEPQQAFARAQQELPALQYTSRDFDPLLMLQAVSAIAKLPPMRKKDFARAAAACVGDAAIGTDPTITLRAILMVIDAPLPAHW